jgi:hypothetical protein
MQGPTSFELSQKYEVFCFAYILRAETFKYDFCGTTLQPFYLLYETHRFQKFSHLLFSSRSLFLNRFILFM